jgi:hypothetical protein
MRSPDPTGAPRETGFIVEDIAPAVEAVGKIEQISRVRCRREFEQRFTDRHMAEDYIRIYQQSLSRSSTQAAAKINGADRPIRSRDRKLAYFSSFLWIEF